jgi:hypothetical protein
MKIKPTLKKLLAGEVSMADTLDFIEAKIVEQGKPALSGSGINRGASGSCVYLTSSGLKCGVGHLITPEDHEEAHHKLEGGVSNVLRMFPLIFGINSEDVYTENSRTYNVATVLGSVQSAHDRPYTENMHQIPQDYIAKFQTRMKQVRMVHAELIAKIDGDLKA